MSSGLPQLGLGEYKFTNREPVLQTEVVGFIKHRHLTGREGLVKDTVEL